MNGGTSPFYLSRSPFSFLSSRRSRLFDFLRRREERILFDSSKSGDKAGLASKEGGKGVDGGASRPPPRGFFISPRSAKVLISGKPSADEIVSCFELPSLRTLESRNAEGSLVGREGEKK